MPTPDPMTSGTLRVGVNDDFVLDAGSWSQIVHEGQQLVTRVTPPSVPMLQQVVDYLEAQPSPADRSVRSVDEARAAVAVCLRCGTYFAALVDASRPFSPDAWDESTSHIADSEMARLNIEISAAIQWWLTLKGSDDQRYAELVRRALAHLPTGRRTVTHVPEGDVLVECATSAMATALQLAWPDEMLERDLGRARKHGVRIIANSITLLSWRNGPVESVHAGRRPGHRFNERRILPRHEKAIIRQAQNMLHTALSAMEHMALDGAWPPPPERVLPFMRPFCHPSDWSYTRQSLEIDLPLNDN